jgi:hypothetical protein
MQVRHILPDMIRRAGCHCWLAPILFGTRFAPADYFSILPNLNLRADGICCIVWGMAHPQRKDVTEPELTGFKYFQQLAPLLARLQDVGCQRDKAGNRQLHYDQYCLLILLYFFNPVVQSLRGLQQASTLNKVQKLLGCQRAALGSLSEARQVFDPERLREIIGEMADKLPPITRDSRLNELRDVVTLVDGTLLAALPREFRSTHWDIRALPTRSGLNTRTISCGWCRCG